MALLDECSSQWLHGFPQDRGTPDDWHNTRMRVADHLDLPAPLS